MNKDLSCMVQDEPVARCAQSPAEKAGLPQPVADFLRAALDSLASVRQPAIHFRGNLTHQNLVLALVVK